MILGSIALDHVQIAAPPGCEAEARRFFGGLLGLEELEKPEPLRSRGGVWFALGGGGQLHVGVEDPFAPARKAHPAFRLPRAELDELAKRLEAAGEHVAWDDSLPGVRRFYTTDPWGNRLELLAIPPRDSVTPVNQTHPFVARAILHAAGKLFTRPS